MKRQVYLSQHAYCTHIHVHTYTHAYLNQIIWREAFFTTRYEPSPVGITAEKAGYRCFSNMLTKSNGQFLKTDFRGHMQALLVKCFHQNQNITSKY